jgi:hypothetical protein
MGSTRPSHHVEVTTLRKGISAYLNTFVAPVKKFLKTLSRDLQRNSIQFGPYDFLNVFNILKPLSFEGSFHFGKEKKICWGKIRRLGWVAYLHNTVFGQKCLHYQCGIGRGIHATRTNCPLLEILASPRKCAQQSSDNLSIESTIDFLLHHHRRFATFHKFLLAFYPV